MVQHLLGLVVVAAFVLGTTSVTDAAVDPGNLCKDKKAKAVGKATLDLLKAFGKNVKKTNLGKLGSDVSKAKSKLTKGFTKAEFTGKGNFRGCLTTEDVDVIEAKVEMLVLETIGTASPMPRSASPVMSPAAKRSPRRSPTARVSALAPFLSK